MTTFAYWNVDNYKDQKLVTRNGKEIIYRYEGLADRWVVREYSPISFYHGSTLVRYTDPADLARYLNELGANPG
jgi:hypothetical protein